MRRITDTRENRTAERGQVLAIFALALVAIIAMTGLVLDGGSTFVQRRDMQNVADAAAMAGAYDYLTTGSDTSATAAAKAAAASNGYVDGADGVVVTVVVASNWFGGNTVQVDVSKPHRNMFAGIVGLSSWGVSTTATVLAGAPNAAIGAMPLIFNDDAFPGAQDPTNPVGFDEPLSGQEDVPQGGTQFNWTVYCTASGPDSDGDEVPDNCNANSDTVEDLIENDGTSTQVELDMAIAPLNAGSHTTLFSEMAQHVGEEFPVCIVDDDGDMVGWAMFHLTGAVGGSTKQIQGYFVTPVNNSSIYIAQGAGAGSNAFGANSVRLID